MKAPALLQALLLACGGFGVLSTDLQSEPSLSLQVSPRVCLAPCAITTTTTIPANPDNRWLVVQVSGPTYQGTMRQLDGMAAPRVVQVPFAHLEEGSYAVLALLYRGAPGREVARATLTVQVSH